ncbi:GNAT family N-acetyltransferase [Candidatus Thiodiazotropha sp. CDECU1]|uniref:GNAT family N-acetyltransferase n=1 Tax=Candidatus Thiodiazotropha sp. CDECU1 TaxID=3065865 RepID=UPI00292E9373|nr:GNAT family N-acetyltransferase [Candidatus Thiodiazotropha sp. CDECU1]
MSSRLMIDATYCERITLNSGENVCLRMVRPSDKAAMLRAFAELSGPSRHKRFFAAKQTLTENDLRYFTETDGWDHFALGAVVIDEDGREGDGLGIARFIRLNDDPECAEVAITVIDRMQGNGVGRALLERLVTAAVERGITRFRFECLAHNQEMQHLVKKVCRVVETRSDGEIIIAETDLPSQIPQSPPSAPEHLYHFYDLFRAMAIQSVDLQMSLSRVAIKRSMRTSFIGADMLKRMKRPSLFKSG